MSHTLIQRVSGKTGEDLCTAWPFSTRFSNDQQPTRPPQVTSNFTRRRPFKQTPPFTPVSPCTCFPLSLSHSFPPGAVCRSARATDLDLKGPRRFYVSKARALSLGTIVRPPGSVAQEKEQKVNGRKGIEERPAGRKTFSRGPILPVMSCLPA